MLRTGRYGAAGLCTKKRETANGNEQGPLGKHQKRRRAGQAHGNGHKHGAKNDPQDANEGGQGTIGRRAVVARSPRQGNGGQNQCDGDQVPARVEQEAQGAGSGEASNGAWTSTVPAIVWTAAVKAASAAAARSVRLVTMAHSLQRIIHTGAYGVITGSGEVVHAVPYGWVMLHGFSPTRAAGAAARPRRPGPPATNPGGAGHRCRPAPGGRGCCGPGPRAGCGTLPTGCRR